MILSILDTVLLEIFSIFLDNGKPPFSRVDILFNEKAGRHAEQILLEDILNVDWTNPGQLIDNDLTIELKMNLSPCWKCANKLYNLAINNPSLDLRIKVIKVYKHYHKKTTQALKRLLRCANVNVTVLTMIVKEYELFDTFVPVDMQTMKKLDGLREQRPSHVKQKSDQLTEQRP